MKAFVSFVALMAIALALNTGKACDVNQFRLGFAAPAYSAPLAFNGGCVQQFVAQPVYAQPFVVQQFAAPVYSQAFVAQPFVGYAAPFRAFGFQRGFRATPFRPFVGPVPRGFRFR